MATNAVTIANKEYSNARTHKVRENCFNNQSHLEIIAISLVQDGE